MRVENGGTSNSENILHYDMKLFENKHGIKLDEREKLIFYSAYNLGRMSAFEEKAQIAKRTKVARQDA